MLNVVMYVLAEENYGEKDLLKARQSVRAQVTRMSQAVAMDGGTGRSTRPAPDLPIDEEMELRKKYNIPADLPMLPPAPPPMVPQDGANPFPGLDPPVG